MRVIGMGLLFAVLLGCSNSSSGPVNTASWNEIESDTYTYSFRIPGIPKRTVTDKRHLYRLELSGGDLYGVYVFALPPGKDINMAKLVDGFLVEVGTKAHYERLLNRECKVQDTYPACDYAGESPDKKKMVRAKIVGGTGCYYVLFVEGKKAFVQSPEADAFLGAFKITRK